MTTTVKALGEFGWNGKTYIVLDIEGAKRYWYGLDGADGPETDSLLAKLKGIGALRQEGDNLNIVTLDEAKELGRQDATNAVNESGEVESPDGGWDSWLIQGVGLRGACQMLGEPESEQVGGWSEAMKAKLEAYNRGANLATQEVAGEVDLASLIPEQPVYDLEGDIATISVETGRRNKSGSVETEEVTARLSVTEKDGEYYLTAEYVSHTGELSQDRIDWAIKCIETNQG